MIVYVESNFILEIALEQEQAQAAHAILTLAESSKLKLAFPSFVLSEPFESVMRERRERNALHDSLVKTLNRLQRSEPHKQILVNLKPVIRILKDAYVREIDLLHSTFDRLLSVGECIEVNIFSFRDAVKYQKNLDLSPQDSIVYSAMVADLKRRPEHEVKCFLSRDNKAFDNDDNRSIKAELEVYNCRYIGSFTQGLSFIQHTLEASPQTTNGITAEQ